MPVVALNATLFTLFTLACRVYPIAAILLQTETLKDVLTFSGFSGKESLELR